VLVLDLLLRLREGQSPNLLEARLASEGQTIRSRLSGEGCRQLRAIRIADDPFASTEHEDSVGTGFDAVLQVAMRPDADAALLVGAVKGASERLGDWIDPSRSAALIGQQHVIVPGEGPIWLVYAIRRLPELTREAFLDHWLHKHADIARAVPGLTGYCQVHADPEASRAAAEAGSPSPTSMARQSAATPTSASSSPRWQSPRYLLARLKTRNCSSITTVRPRSSLGWHTG
jgi:hypothetical protein